MGLITYKCVLRIMQFLLVLGLMHNAHCRKKVDPTCPRGRCDDDRCPRNDNERCLEDDCSGMRRRCVDTLLCIWKDYRSCPDEACTEMENTCADGSCVVYDEPCGDGSEPCRNYHKRCEAGYCIHTGSRCPEDPCPDNMQYKCGGKCNYMSVVCDGYDDCPDGSDELGCNEKDKNLYWLLLLLLLPLMCCCYCCYKCWTDDDDDKGNSSGETANNQEGIEINPGVNSGMNQFNNIAPTAVIQNTPTGMHVTYQPPIVNNQTYPPNPVNTPLIPPSAPPVIPSYPDASAPPGYHEVVGNQFMYHPPPKSDYFPEKA